MVVERLAVGGDEAVPDLVSLSSTCRDYRARVAPFAFRTVKLRNNRASGMAARSIASSVLRDHVEVLRFRGRFRWNISGGRNANGDLAARKFLPVVVHRLLGNLSAFPKLHTVSVQFDADHEMRWPARQSVADESTDPVRLAQFDVILAFRQAMEDAFQAVASNTGLVKRLEILDLITRPFPIFETPRFRAFLATLDRLKLSLTGADTFEFEHGLDEHWTSLVYVKTQMHSLFLDHLTDLRDLRYRGCPLEGSYRLGAPHRYALTEPKWSVRQMRSLQNIHLGAIRLTKELLTFIRGHSHTLQRVELHRAYASPQSTFTARGTPMTWATFLGSILDAEIPALRHLDVQPETVPLVASALPARDRARMDGAGFALPTLPANDPAEVAAALQAVWTDPRRRMFAYELQDGQEYAFVVDDHVANLENFVRGDDQRAWDELMELFRRRARERRSRDRRVDA